jgi:hypothetical protein
MLPTGAAEGDGDREKALIVVGAATSRVPGCSGILECCNGNISHTEHIKNIAKMFLDSIYVGIMGRLCLCNIQPPDKDEPKSASGAMISDVRRMKK